MLDLNEVAVFLKVVEMGSFSKAAQNLGMPNSTVSAKVSQLEAALRTTLIRRTTRKLFITEEGQLFYDKCKRGVSEIQLAQEAITQSQSEPQGVLKLTAPVDFGSAILPKLIYEYKTKYPKVSFDIFLNDRMVDVVGEGFDLAIRVGQLKDSGLISKKVGEIYFAPFASPGYLKKFKPPKSPADLKHHRCIQFAALGNTWKLIGPKTITVDLKNEIIVNELNTIKELTASGMGIALLPTFLCADDIKKKRLIRVLPEWRTNLQPISIVYGGDRYVSPKVRSFITIGADLLKGILRDFKI